MRPTGAIGTPRRLWDGISRGYGITTDAEGTVYAVGETTAQPGSTDPYVVALRP